MRHGKWGQDGAASMGFGSVLRGLAAAGGVALAIAAAPLALGPSQGAWAQGASGGRDIQALIDRIDRLQRELTTLQREVYRGRGPGAGGGTGSGPSPAAGALGAPGEPNLAAAMQVRLDEIETQMRGFTGQLEELSHAIDMLRKRVDKLSSDMDYRLKALESRATAGPQGQGRPPGFAQRNPQSAAPPGTPPAPAPGQAGVLGTIPQSDLDRGQAGAGAAAPPQEQGQAARAPTPTAPPPPKGSPEAQYRFATGLLFQSDFEGAERAFSQFLAANPDHELAGNAQYWLGETHYVRGDFRTAASVFAEGYQKYPKSGKSPDNLLKLGLSLAAIDKKESACATFERLLKEFPEADSSVRSRARSQRETLRCR